MAPVLLIHPADNVQVVLDRPENGVPVGHKIARQAIPAGSPVIKYGDPIGIARQDIADGEWVHTHNLRSGLSAAYESAPTLAGRFEQPRQPADADSGDKAAASFDGYLRRDGQVGIRNEIWIIPTVGCVNHTAEKLAALGQARLAAGAWNGVDGVYCFPHPYGCSQLGADHAQTRRILADLIGHPNAGGVLVLGLGCENNQISGLQEELGSWDPDRVAFLAAQDVPDELGAGIVLLERLAAHCASSGRQSCPWSSLVIGLKCGASDAFSGLTANPLLGRLTDRLAGAGARVLLTEVPEMFGAEHLLLGRAASPEIHSRLDRLFRDFRDYYTRHGQPVDENPSPGNKAGGITTLAEKSLGCTQKAGQATVEDVIRYGGRVRRPGLTILEGPGNDPVACTALAAAGAQLILFTTGRGNPLGGPVPTLKISSNQQLADRKPHWIDLDAGPALLGQSARDQLDQELLRLVLAVAGGQSQTRSEINGYREIAIFKDGVTL
ncbi:MAG TPA: altronate hydrolase [Clostridiales bacterium]|nr:altronate hydrolase [Clostridiales bacterium]